MIRCKIYIKTTQLTSNTELFDRNSPGPRVIYVIFTFKWEETVLGKLMQSKAWEVLSWKLSTVTGMLKAPPYTTPYCVHIPYSLQKDKKMREKSKVSYFCSWSNLNTFSVGHFSIGRCLSSLEVSNAKAVPR